MSGAPTARTPPSPGVPRQPVSTSNPNRRSTAATSQWSRAGTPVLTSAAAAHGLHYGISRDYAGPRLALPNVMLAAVETTIAFLVILGCVLRPLTFKNA